ncbi:aprataxin-like isoform X2 [Uloborus diversus]|nr:aprataxin-like isoform X2 [Uloborus diversus]XP_054712882.1 aprataxin-like isoform X2 [Uloborus diversus]
MKVGGHWSQGLKASMHDPSLIVKQDELIVIIKDKYPKAKHHYLILPKADVRNLKALNIDHLSLLKHMQDEAKKLINGIESPSGFKIGYHAVPSMSQLHLHAISQDFDSPCLKTKTHWNAFTTEYFIDSEDVIRDVEKYGKVCCIDERSAKEILKKDLRCHICNESLKNMPKLKEHILVHMGKKNNS